MRIQINGAVHDLPEEATVRDAALTVGVEPSVRGVAVAVDGEVVPSGEHESRPLREGQRVEVVNAIGGGR